MTKEGMHAVVTKIAARRARGLSESLKTLGNCSSISLEKGRSGDDVPATVEVLQVVENIVDGLDSQPLGDRHQNTLPRIFWDDSTSFHLSRISLFESRNEIIENLAPYSSANSKIISSPSMVCTIAVCRQRPPELRLAQEKYRIEYFLCLELLHESLDSLVDCSEQFLQVFRLFKVSIEPSHCDNVSVTLRLAV